MQINKAQFVCSSERLSQLPKDSLPEFAFIGRSNVGKSSLVNMLTGRSGLAKVSGTPGKDAAYQPFPHQRQLVSGRSARLRLRPHIENPTRRVRQNHHRLRTPMRTDALPVRAGRFPTGAPEDRLRFIEMLGREGIPFGIVFTKTTNCRPHSSHAASNATNKCSVNSGRGCLRCSAPRAKNGRAAKRSWTSSANV